MTVKLTERETKVLGELRSNIEGSSRHDDRGVWMTVYLPNCPSSKERGFNGVLGNLYKKGLYDGFGDDCFGEVRCHACDKCGEPCVGEAHLCRDCSPVA